MHFSVEKSLFLNLLQKVVGVIPSKTSIPILSNILFELEAEQLTLSGTDLEISISATIQVEMEQEGALTIPARMLLDIVRELPDIPLEFSSDPLGNVTLKTEKGTYKLAGVPKDEFPNITIEENDGQITVTSKQLSRMITKTIFAVSSDELRTTLMGVFVQISADDLRMVATDGHRLSKIVDQHFSSSELEKSMIIPTKALNLILKNFDSLSDKEPISVQISFGENHATFSWEGTAIYTKLIEGKYPKYENVIPFDNDLRLLVDRDSLQASVKRVSIFSNSITHQIRFVITASQVDIRSEDVEFGGEAKETLPADFNGPDMEMGYNAQYVLECLKNIDTPELVFLVKDPKSAALIQPATQKEGEDFQMLLMPIRLRED